MYVATIFVKNIPHRLLQKKIDKKFTKSFQTFTGPNKTPEGGINGSGLNIVITSLRASWTQDESDCIHIVILEGRLCEVGYFSDIVGYRKIYGNCPHNDIGPGTVETNVEDCRQRCEAEPTCVAFAFENKEIIYTLGGSGLDTNCYIKSMCFEDKPGDKPAVYIYFKELVKGGKNFYFV